MTEKNEQPSLDIELSEKIAEGMYTNFSIISHSDTEFVIDFVRVIPGMPKGRVKSRIILNPVHAKQFLELFNHQVQVYEKQFGEIHLPGQVIININKPLGQA